MIKGKALDDRVGCYILCETLKKNHTTKSGIPMIKELTETFRTSGFEDKIGTDKRSKVSGILCIYGAGRSGVERG